MRRKLSSFISRVRNRAAGKGGSPDFEASRYWESRYASGGNSGDGSYGELASFKASVINGLIAEFGLRSAIEFGCGDGEQLAMMNYPSYTGLDVSPSAVSRCIRKFETDTTKNFFLYDPGAFRDATGIFTADLALSLDVIYHIVADEVFEAYMSDLCDASTGLIVIYSTDTDAVEAEHVRHRAFSRWMSRNRPDLRLERTIPNPHPGVGEQESNAGFHVYLRNTVA